MCNIRPTSCAAKIDTSTLSLWNELIPCSQWELDSAGGSRGDRFWSESRVLSSRMAQSALTDDMEPACWAALEGNVLQTPAPDGGWPHPWRQHQELISQLRWTGQPAWVQPRGSPEEWYFPSQSRRRWRIDAALYFMLATHMRVNVRYPIIL